MTLEILVGLNTSSGVRYMMSGAIDLRYLTIAT